VSSTVFPFILSRLPEADETPTFKTRIVGGNNGIDQRAADFGDDYKLRVTGSLRLPQASTSKTLADWLSFVESMKGQYDSFLYSPFSQRYRVVTDEALGTSGTVFPLDSKHINAATLVVKRNGSTLTLTTHYTFAGNNTAPTVTLLSAAGGDAITASYERYYPMFLTSDGLAPRMLTSDTADATRKVRIDQVEMIETMAGGHLV